MGKRYLLFVSASYSYPILQPVEDAIKRRGGECRWFIEPGVPNLLPDGETPLCLKQAIEYDPTAVIVPGNNVYSFLPGVKVCIFHGYAINKRAERRDDHFKMRGWFDIYCTQGESSTPEFKRLEKQCGWFRVYETGWSKPDAYFGVQRIHNSTPTILYTSTFTHGISSQKELFGTIQDIASRQPWQWDITFHPLFKDEETKKAYEHLASVQPNVHIIDGPIGTAILQKADAMLCDSSSAIVEAGLMGIPVVSYCNTQPGPHLENVLDKQQLESVLGRVLANPGSRMQELSDYVHYHEGHFDGNSSDRILDAIDRFIEHDGKGLRRKPLNLWRRVRQSFKLLKHYLRGHRF